VNKGDHIPGHKWCLHTSCDWPRHGIVCSAMQASDDEGGGDAEDGYSSDDSAEETVEQKKLRLGAIHKNVHA
jgi:hypothetical protein